MDSKAKARSSNGLSCVRSREARRDAISRWNAPRAAEAGVIGADACRTLIAAQADLIDREIAAARCTSGARETLTEMRAEYRQVLNR